MAGRFRLRHSPEGLRTSKKLNLPPEQISAMRVARWDGLRTRAKPILVAVGSRFIRHSLNRFPGPFLTVGFGSVVGLRRLSGSTKWFLGCRLWLPGTQVNPS